MIKILCHVLCLESLKSRAQANLRGLESSSIIVVSWKKDEIRNLSYSIKVSRRMQKASVREKFPQKQYQFHDVEVVLYSLRWAADDDEISPIWPKMTRISLNHAPCPRPTSSRSPATTSSSSHHPSPAWAEEKQFRTTNKKLNQTNSYHFKKSREKKRVGGRCGWRRKARKKLIKS